MERADFLCDVSKRAGFVLSADAKVLDFGCGAGDAVVSFVRKNYNVYWYDITQQFSEDAKNHLDRFMFFQVQLLRRVSHLIGLLSVCHIPMDFLMRFFRAKCLSI